MKTITIKVHKIHRIVSTNYRRTSDGYIYDADDITSYEIWLSSPISFSNEAELERLIAIFDNVKPGNV
jgi:hypothetical protein